jgi:O-antigen biosynthesis protein
MHRSGSSALSRVVNLLGATAPATLLPPGTDNPRGFWESARLVSMHDELLQSAGSYWHDWRPLDPAWFRTPIAAEFKNRLKQAIESEFGDATLLVIKDPRICRMVPFWTELLTELEIEPVALTPLRNPLEVAKSLQTRNGFRLEKSLLLWLRHVLEAERDSRSLRRSFVSYESLLTDWRACLGRAASQTGLEWSGLSSETEQHVDQFLTRDLHREMALEADLLTNPIATKWINCTHSLLARLVDEPESPSVHHALDQIREEFETACRAFEGLLTAEQEIADHLRAELDKIAQTKQVETANLHVNLTKALKRTEDLERELEARSVEAETLHKRIDAQIAATETLQNELAQQSCALETARKETVDARLPLEAITSSRTWRFAVAMRRFRRPVRQVSASATKLLKHYHAWRAISCHPGARIISESGMFDGDWYLTQYPDVARAGLNPLLHFISFGAAEGRDPHPLFDTSWYLKQNPDVAAANMNPLEHYLKYGAAEGRAPGPLVHNLPGVTPKRDAYQLWIASRTVGARERAYMAGVVAEMKHKPVFSVLMPTYKSDLRLLAKAIDSVRNQVYPYWELCIVDDGSASPELGALLERYAGYDQRVKLHLCAENSGISAATNIAVEMAHGEFVALFDHDDELAPHALFAMAHAANKHPNADMIYSDEDKINEAGHRFGPFFKPDWSPEFMLSCMYTCHLGVYRRSLVEAVGGFRPEFDFAQDYDLALRVSARAREIVHVPDILYHWRVTSRSTAGGADAKPTAELAARRAVQAALDVEGLTGRVIESAYRGMHRIDLDLPGEPLVSIVIPSAGRRISQGKESWYLLDLLRSISAKSTYKNIEIVLVHNGDLEQKLSNELRAFSIKYVHYAATQFNIAEKMNLGVESASGTYIILLNDDMTVISPGWIEKMLMWFSKPGVVGVGAKLLFPDDTVQHAGVLLLGQGPSHVYYGATKDYPGLVGSACLVRNYAAVTGACLMTRRRDYVEVGGFDPSFRINYNDIDFCMRLGERGRIVYTPYALLYHYESVSKDQSSPDELKRFNERWSRIVGNDSFYNRNLSQTSSFMDIAPQPRRLQDDY